MISKKSRSIINLSKKLGHIPQGVTMEDLSQIKRESYAAYSKAPKKTLTMEDWKPKRRKK